MSREIAIVNYIIHHDYFHIGIKEQASDALGPGRHCDHQKGDGHANS
jgi:hypothetical protein